jgi:hypothetical protein
MTRFNNCLYLIVILVGTLASLTVPLSAGATTFSFDSRQTYFLTNNDPRALDAIPINLASLGLSSISVLTDFWEEGKSRRRGEL